MGNTLIAPKKKGRKDIGWEREMEKSVKLYSRNCQGLWRFLPYFKANKLDCHGFIGTDWRHTTRWSKTENPLLTAVAVASVSAFYA